MAFRWNDTTERIMLIKFLEQNLAIKLDVQAALASWPGGPSVPTVRSITDRFNHLKKQIRQGTVAGSLGTSTPTVASSSTVNTPSQAVPKTPRSTKQSSKKLKAKADSSDAELKATPNPISNAKGSSSSKFQSKLRGTADSNGKQGTKRKRSNKTKANASDEASMSDNDSDSDCADADVHGDDEPESPSETRRSLPRRSKSMTPARYRIQTESASESTVTGETDDVDNNEKASKGKGKEIKKELTSDEEDGSDQTFDLVAHQISEKDGRKRKASWKERVAMIDGHDGNGDDLDN